MQSTNRGRPAGRRHDTVIHVRLPRPAIDAFRKMARGKRATLSQLVRSAILEKLTGAIGPLARIANSDAAASERMRAMRLLRMIATVGLHLGPAGLQLARARAMQTK